MYPGEDTRYPIALPVELYHQICFFLDVKDVLALRKTCKYFFMITQERGLWSMMFARLCATQPLPCSRAEFTAMSSSRAERVLFSAPKVEASYLELRECIAHRDLSPTAKPPYAPLSAWRVLSFISDRFLLSVNSNAALVWDASALASASPMAAPLPWAHFPVSDFLGFTECDSTLYIAVSRPSPDHSRVVIYSVRLPLLEESDNVRGRLHWEAEFPLYDAHLFKHMDPNSGRALLYCMPPSIHIVHWRNGNRRITIPLQSDDADQQWNGVITMRFCGPYILCFRVRSVEVYPIPTDTPTADPLPILEHRFGAVCFRDMSLSRIRVSRRASGDVYTVFMLANDVHQGMFHYHIRLTTTPVASMSVHVLAKGSIRTSEPLPLIPGTNVRYTSEDMIKRTFVSTWSVGSAGLRGVWVDRQRGSVDRRVVAFTTHPSRLPTREAALIPGEDSGGDALDVSPSMDGNVIHVISSYDLKDDITICSVSEWTGRIALGSLSTVMMRQLRELLRETAQSVAVVTARLPLGTPTYHGATLSSFSSIALDPFPLVAFSLRVPSRMATALNTHVATHAPAHLVINILSAAQPHLADRFARPDLHPHPFADPHVHWTSSQDGLPVLAGALGALSCRLVRPSVPLAHLRESHARAFDDVPFHEGDEGDSESGGEGEGDVPQADAGTGLASELFIARVLRVERVPLPELDGRDAGLYRLPLLYHRRRYTTVEDHTKS